MQLSLPLRSVEPDRASRDGGMVFVRHRRARRYILRVLDDGTLRVTVPQRGSKRDAQAFAERHAAWVDERRRRVSARPPAPYVDEAALKTRAARELPPQLLELARRHDIAVTRISIRNQRSRWGACSSRGSITLNWRLVLVPGFVREYVMLHELMHRREMNHSPRFWRQVRAVCPRADEARRWLRTEGQLLFHTKAEAC